MSHPSELWTWLNCSDKITALPGKNGYPNESSIQFLGYRIDTNTGKITDTYTGMEITTGNRSYRSATHTIFYVLCAYSEAWDTLNTGRKISSKQFRGNQFTQRGYAGEYINLVRAYGDNPDLLKASTVKLGGSVIDFPVGDIAVQIDLLPRVPMYIVLNVADDEFPAEAWIYFDESIESYFDSEQTYFLTHLAVRRLIEAGKMLGN